MQRSFVNEHCHLDVIGVLRVIQHIREGDAEFKAAYRFILWIKHRHDPENSWAGATNGKAFLRCLIAVR